ncbi:hypothetical protein ACFFX1_55640 [Dactylosporangium sucinum]|uniref:Uncharacterized protein n=1 Tax=Dactylosporangium sucinum TaxID=1424081 RepID=A0A917X031_9ACTN|nr:hypothetical protein [Dactylosporangium sucinum]GGM52298.1 hypothetical protein GCM10007977_062360 [Dactylosporangium sucinum]
MTAVLETVAGADLHEGDRIVLAVTGEHTIARMDRYRRTVGDGMRHAHCTDGTCCTVLDHHNYRRVAG